MKNNKESNKTQRFAIWRTVVFFGLIFTSFGCKKDRIIGLEVQPDGYLDSIQTVDTFTIEASTIISEAQRSTRYQSFVGRIQNPVFGSSESILYLNFGLESENVYLELPTSSYTIDDLVLKYSPLDAYGDNSQSFKLEAYQVEESMGNDSTYLSDRHFRLDDQPIGSTQISIESDSIIGQDSMHLDKALGAFLLQGIGSTYTSSDEFQNYFGGIALRMAELDPTAAGAIFNLALIGEGLGLTLHYHHLDSAGEIVPEQLRFEITTSTVRHNEYLHDYSGSLVENVLNTPSTDDLIFVQGMSGVKADIKIPYLDEFAKKIDVALSKATLTLQSAVEQPVGFDQAGILYLLDYEIDPSTGDTVESLTLDYAFSASRHGGAYLEESDDYVFDITRQVQKVIEASQLGEDVNLGYTLNTQVPVLNGNARSQNVLKGSDNIVLKLYYTDISE